jgi:hypothetical protein
VNTLQVQNNTLQVVSNAVLNPWSGNCSTTTDRKSGFRKSVASFYNAWANKGKTKCMVSGFVGEGDSVIAAHIVPVKAPSTSLRACGMTFADVNCSRNGLMLAKNIEKAFDKLLLSFVPKDPFHSSSLVLKIWDPELFESKLSVCDNSDITIESCEGQPLMFKGNPLIGEEVAYEDASVPFRRALSFQAQQAFAYAQSMGWISRDAEFRPFGTPPKSGKFATIYEVPLESTSFISSSQRRGSVWVCQACHGTNNMDEKKCEHCMLHRPPSDSE